MHSQGTYLDGHRLDCFCHGAFKHLAQVLAHRSIKLCLLCCSL